MKGLPPHEGTAPVANLSTASAGIRMCRIKTGASIRVGNGPMLGPWVYLDLGMSLRLAAAGGRCEG